MWPYSILVILALAAVIFPACGRNPKVMGVATNPDVIADAERPDAGKDNSTCLEPGKVVAGAEYTCEDGTKRKGLLLIDSLYECRSDGEAGCVATSRFRAADTQAAVPGAIKFGVTIAGVAGTLTTQGPADCVADGEVACVSSARFAAAATSGLASKLLSGQTAAGVTGNVTLPSASSVLAGASYGVGGNGSTGSISVCSTLGSTACYTGIGWTGVETSDLTPGNIRNGASIGGVAGGYPSTAHHLAGADTTTDLTSLGATTAAGTYEFFDSAGARYTGSITDAGTIFVGTAAQTFNTSLYRGFTVPGDANLVAGSILSGVSIFGVPGNVSLPATSVVRSGTSYGVGGNGISGGLANCSSEGGSDCVVDAGTSYRAASTTGLADKVLSTASVAGVTGNVTLPASGSVRSSESYGVGGNGTSGTIADCSALGRAGCFNAVGWTAVETTQLVAGVIKSGTSLGGVTGDYPSATYALAGSTAATDLTSLAASTAAGNYEFFDSAGTRYAGSITNAGTISIGTTAQTFNTSLYRGFTVPGDTDLVAANIATGVNLLGVTGSAALRPADCAADGGTSCVAVSGYPAANTTGLASKVLLGQTVAGVGGNVVLPAALDVSPGVTYGANGTALIGTYTGAASDCTADGQLDCRIPASGSPLKAADTTNFNGWDIRKKRNQATGAVLTFAGLAGQNKSCRNRARTALYNNTTAPAVAGLDFFDTIDDYNNNLTGLPGEIPAWTIINSTNYGADYACGGIYATGNVATGNTGADSSLAHDPDGNWQDLTPGIRPGGSNSTNTANGCNASDKHCVFRELISGLMVTERAATSYTWTEAIAYCHALGEAGGAVTSPIPVIGGAAYADWRLPSQKELMQLSYAGIRGLNQTSGLVTFFGDIDSFFSSASSQSIDASSKWHVSLPNGFTESSEKIYGGWVVCVR